MQHMLSTAGTAFILPLSYYDPATERTDSGIHSFPPLGYYDPGHGEDRQ